MALYQPKPKIVEAIMFDEFIAYGRDNGGNIVNGMPWSFSFVGHPVTHEHDELYLIDGGTLKFTPNDMLVMDTKELRVIPKDEFNRLYTVY